MEFEEGKKKLERLKGEDKERVLKTIEILERQIGRLKTYVTLLSKAQL